MKLSLASLALAGALLTTTFAVAPAAQVGKPLTIVDANLAPE